jgi:ABC-type lipoprotein export system ATPase subunit
MQRTAIARALVSNPRVLFADEPTGNLDAESGAEIVKLLRGINRDGDVTILMVTHNVELVRHTDRVVRMAAGRLELGSKFQVPSSKFDTALELPVS